MPFSEDDLKAVREYAQSVHGLYTLRESLNTYIKKASKDAIPNLSAVAGPLIACRLLSIAGGLERLAKLPSSTMQLLGAEKALFRHLKSKDRPPKFGVIFAHPLIQNAGKSDKGRMARLLASKLVMAARADFYTGNDMSEKLLADLKVKSSRPGGSSKAGSEKPRRKEQPRREEFRRDAPRRGDDRERRNQRPQRSHGRQFSRGAQRGDSPGYGPRRGKQRPGNFRKSSPRRASRR